MDKPFGLLAELTYRCPLSCAYCSNPLNLADYTNELSTEEWQRVLTEAQELGVLQCHLSGGEPLVRRDLAQIVEQGTQAGAFQPRRPPGDFPIRFCAVLDGLSVLFLRQMPDLSTGRLTELAMDTARAELEPRRGSAASTGPAPG